MERQRVNWRDSVQKVSHQNLPVKIMWEGTRNHQTHDAKRKLHGSRKQWQCNVEDEVAMRALSTLPDPLCCPCYTG